MELVEGDDLAVRVAHGPVPVVETIEMARQIAEALEAARQPEASRGDITPLLRSRSGNAA